MCIKRGIAVLLTAVLAVSFMPVSRLSAEETVPDRVTAEVMIAPQFEDAKNFSEGLAAVKMDGKWGYINTEGNVVVPFAYDLAYSFNEGYAVVAKDTGETAERQFWDGEWNGDDPVYRYETLPVYEVGFVDKEGSYTQFDLTGKPFPNSGGLAYENNFYGAPEDADYKFQFHEGVVVLVFFGKGNVHLFSAAFGRDGKRICFPGGNDATEYVPFGNAGNGMIPTYVLESQDYDGYSTIDGKNVIRGAELDEKLSLGDGGFCGNLSSFCDGIAYVSYLYGIQTGYMGFINTDFEWIIKPKDIVELHYDMETGRVFFDGLAPVKNEEDLWGVINKRGQTVVDFMYDDVGLFQCKRARFLTDDLCGYLDSKGKVVIPARYLKASIFSEKGVAVVKADMDQFDGYEEDDESDDDMCDEDKNSDMWLINIKGEKIPGSAAIAKTYFSKSVGSYDLLVTPCDYPIFKEDGLYGYAHITYQIITKEDETDCVHSDLEASAYFFNQNEHWKQCPDCGDVIGKSVHIWNQGVVTTEATVEKTGVRTFTCASCGKTKEEIIAKKEVSLQTGEVPPQTGKKDTVSATKVKITGVSKKVALGGKIMLSAEVMPLNTTDKTVTWRSDNKNYATVSSKGEVKVTSNKKYAGKSVTITATTNDGSGQKAIYKIRIMKDAVKSVKIRAEKNTVAAGKSMMIKATIRTTGTKVNKSLKWISSNPKYAAVTAKGKFSAKKAGKGKTVTVTAVSTDGSNKKASVKIKIK